MRVTWHWDSWCHIDSFWGQQTGYALGISLLKLVFRTFHVAEIIRCYKQDNNNFEQLHWRMQSFIFIPVLFYYTSLLHAFSVNVHALQFIESLLENVNPSTFHAIWIVCPPLYMSICITTTCLNVCTDRWIFIFGIFYYLRCIKWIFCLLFAKAIQPWLLCVGL